MYNPVKEALVDHAKIDQSSYFVPGMVMFLLSLQTGLIELKMPNRLGAMTIILFIVAASLLQTILEVRLRLHATFLLLAQSNLYYSFFRVLVV